jgi:hypothetical protein
MPYCDPQFRVRLRDHEGALLTEISEPGTGRAASFIKLTATTWCSVLNAQLVSR